MLKRLAILAVVLTVAQPYAPVPGQTADNDAGKSNGAYPESKQGKKNRGGPASIPGKIAADKPQHKSTDADSPDNKNSVSISESISVPTKRDWLDYVSLSLTGILIAITGGGVFVAWRGLPALFDQARSTRIAAESATENTKALVDSERAWMVVKPEGDILTGSFKAVASNQGRTPATIVSWEYGYGIAPHPNWNLPPAPDYFGKMPWMKGILVAPQNQFEAMHSTGVLLNAFYNKSSDLDQLCIYGRIVYWHTFSERKEADIPCETRWCFRFRADARDYTPYGGEYDRAT
jgi:hypothetical protein